MLHRLEQLRVAALRGKEKRIPVFRELARPFPGTLRDRLYRTRRKIFDELLARLSEVDSYFHRVPFSDFKIFLTASSEPDISFVFMVVFQIFGGGLAAGMPFARICNG